MHNTSINNKEIKQGGFQCDKLTGITLDCDFQHIFIWVPYVRGERIIGIYLYIPLSELKTLCD